MKEIFLGLMRIANMSQEEVDEYLLAAIELGYTSFDLADIYGNRKCEELFGNFLKKHQELRGSLYIQTKCGIDKKNKNYNSMKDYIINQTLESLRLLNCHYLDSLLIHRPDILVDYNEVAEAFTYLKNNNLVKEFGVSNMSPLQIEAIEKNTGFKVSSNQVQFSLAHNFLVTEGIFFNMINPNYTAGLIDYARIKKIKLQAWSVILDSNRICFLDNQDYNELNKELEKLAIKYQTTKAVIAVAWILKHPANIIPIIGTTKIARLIDYKKALEIELSHNEYYDLLKATGIVLP